MNTFRIARGNLLTPSCAARARVVRQRTPCNPGARAFRSSAAEGASLLYAISRENQSPRSAIGPRFLGSMVWPRNEVHVPLYLFYQRDAAAFTWNSSQGTCDGMGFLRANLTCMLVRRCACGVNGTRRFDTRIPLAHSQGFGIDPFQRTRCGQPRSKPLPSEKRRGKLGTAAKRGKRL